MPKLPGSTIPLEKGAPPPQWCPRCAAAGTEPKDPARKLNGWTAVPGNLPQWYRERGFRALAQCSGCMYVLVTEG